MDEIFQIADVRDDPARRQARHHRAAARVHAAVDDRAHRRPPVGRLLRPRAAGRRAWASRCVELRGVSGARQPRNVDLIVPPRRGRGRGRPARQRPQRAGARALRHRPAGRRRDPRSRASRSAITEPAGRDRAPASRSSPRTARRQGFVADHSVASNICLPVLDRLSRGGWVDRGKRRSGSPRSRSGGCGSRPHSPESPVRSLSGGNAQKVVIAKWLATEPDVLDPRRADRRHRHRQQVARSWP